MGDDLETRLLAAWDVDDLAVYGDQLLAAGDPRGELVQLDLAPQPNLRTWWTRRRAALESWLGSELATRAGHLVQHGFVHELREGFHPTELLDTRLGAVVRSFTTWGGPRVARSLARLAQRQRPWLRRLAIAYWGTAPIDDRVRVDLIAATPRLEELVLLGNAAFDSFPHPALRRATVDRRYFTVFPRGVEVTQVKVPEGCAGLAPDSHDIELLLELVDGTGDCNVLYTLELGEPVAPLLVRLAAAGLVGLDGTVARLISTTREAAAWGGYGAPRIGEPRGPRMLITGDRGVQLRLEGAAAHRQIILDAIDRLPMAAEYRDILERHLGQLATAWSTDLDEPRTRALAMALAAVLEGRALWPGVVRVRPELAWQELEALIELLVTARNGATIAALWADNYYDY